MVEYEREFDRLSSFATGQILNPENKRKRFIVGLRDDIRGHVRSLRPATYEEALDSALAVDIGSFERRAKGPITQTSSQKRKAEDDSSSQGI